MTISKNRIDYLDSLRGIAALAVVFFHMNGGYSPFFPMLPPWIWKTPFHALVDGPAAVSLFFVLSGLVLSLKYLARGGFSLRTDLFSFVVNRAIRICFPFIAVVFLSFLAHHTISDRPIFWNVPGQKDWMKNIWSAPIGFQDLLRQFFLPFPAPSSHLIPQDWSLTVEFNVSLLMPFFILVASQYIGALWFLVRNCRKLWI